VLVDDMGSILTLYGGLLTKAGHEVKRFSSAKQAMEYLADNEPDIIISDIKMPDIDGFAFKSWYTREHPSRRTPFVFLSALAESKEIVHGLEQGVDEYLVKPVPAEMLLDKVRSLLDRKQRDSRES